MLLAAPSRMRTLVFAALALLACGGDLDKSNDDASGGSSGSEATGGMGATPGTGGSPGQSVEPGDCGPVLDFRMLGGGPAASSEFCVGKPQSCSRAWFQILDSTGNGVSTELPCSVTSCSSCQVGGCILICATSTPLLGEGMSTTWNGIQWVDAGPCGDNVECRAPVCAPAGDYVARFCGHALESGASGAPAQFDECENNAASEPTCVDVPFSYPSTNPVIGVLDPTR